MRHKVYGKHLGRDKNQRTALFKSLVRSLILEEQIETTEAKAKAVKGLVDKLINQAKSPTTQRVVFQFVTDKRVQEKLVNSITPRLDGRTSGYTSVVRLGRRLGDGTQMVKMSLLVSDQIGLDQMRSEKSPVTTQSVKSEEKVEKTVAVKKSKEKKK